MAWYDTDDFDYAYFLQVWGEQAAPSRRAMSRRERARLRRMLDDAQARYQRMFDDLVAAATGMAPDQIIEPLALAFAEIGREPSADELRAAAERVSRGERIVLDRLFPEV